MRQVLFAVVVPRAVLAISQDAMPQAIDELRREWWPADDPTGIDTAIGYLRARGYTLSVHEGGWSGPGREPTDKEQRAIRYLMDEWDFGGLVR